MERLKFKCRNLKLNIFLQETFKAQKISLYVQLMLFWGVGGMEARILEWVAFPSPDLPDPGIEARSPAL